MWVDAAMFAGYNLTPMKEGGGGKGRESISTEVAGSLATSFA
jgi:hypothetical protein